AIISELNIGMLRLTLRLEGYEPVAVNLTIDQDQTAKFHTTLISRGYTQAITAAKHYLQSRNYDGALEAISDALRTKPDDSVATALKPKAEAGVRLNRAKDLGQQGNYRTAIKEIEAALQLLPDHSEAEILLGQ